MVKLTDVFVVLRPPCWSPSEGHQHGVSIQNSTNMCEALFQNNARMKNRTELNLGKVFYVRLIYDIKDSWLNSLNGYDIYF